MAENLLNCLAKNENEFILLLHTISQTHCISAIQEFFQNIVLSKPNLIKLKVPK